MIGNADAVLEMSSSVMSFVAHLEVMSLYRKT
jgi:hypothetical protein